MRLRIELEYQEVNSQNDNGLSETILTEKDMTPQTIGMIQILEVMEDIMNMIHHMVKELLLSIQMMVKITFMLDNLREIQIHIHMILKKIDIRK